MCIINSHTFHEKSISPLFINSNFESLQIPININNVNKQNEMFSYITVTDGSCRYREAYSHSMGFELDSAAVLAFMRFVT